MWNTLLRGMSDGRPAGIGTDGGGYFATCTAIGRHFRPGDIYAGTRLAAAEAADAGITTVHDWAHNVRGRDWAEAGLRALGESGLRARFSYGYEAGHANSRLMALDDLADLASRWSAYEAGGRLHLGLAWRGAGGSNPAMRVAPELYRTEIAAARAGTPVSVSPWTELQIGYGQPVTGELLAAIDGARSLGLGRQTGSLAPGKRADVIVVSADAPNLGVLTDPARLLVTAASPRDVDLVVADGRILKRGGVLTAAGVAEVTRSAREALSGCSPARPPDKHVESWPGESPSL